MSSAPSPIGVLIVDDSPFMRLALQKILGLDSRLKVLGIARDGKEGIAKLRALHPQVVTMDVEMPVMDGLRALDEIMRWQPTPVIILSALTTEGAHATLKALDLGAVDVVAKPAGSPGTDLAAMSRDLIEKIRAAAEVDPSRLGVSPGKGCSSGAAANGVKASETDRHKVSAREFPGGKAFSSPLAEPHARGFVAGVISAARPQYPVEVVAIGTSTGGPAALQTVLPQLPQDFPVPVVVAQHMPPGFTGPLAQRLNGLCSLEVREGKDGEALRAGIICVAPAGKQTQVVRKAGRLCLAIGEESPIPTLYHPSVDVLFLSLAREVGGGTLGVVMTGMGRDGAEGMKQIKALGGFAIAEAEESCVVYGMPKALVEGGLADRVVPLGEIGRTITECVMGG
ncbi:protein-glutamate methylesterase [Acididesulfobacillus acetoxydans]|uniref:Protein-glutamate methylesterase/protein-glutamine glutaminase n=1 Tax=Acididesulfobacillus acetoxydans TaxID=1561005 RepID=A0A8S0X171_9FIRM|nr:chemotaxis response regulator protein-glutamate methylesterase [Acididesulfobacillus acetoxydans]CAA7602971.1 protein-glutamate methylesterase [Acididesulfobacillus acetoxydans]CEJ05853.1 Chemotaxis response regulator protein-glutamate methylesterase [Acididesulfobacillus acetoxydans]